MATQAQKALFKDKTTLVLRVLLKNPKRPWTVRELINECGVSAGLISKSTGTLYDLGMAEIERGRNGYIQLTKPKELLREWVASYDFSLNTVESLYTPSNTTLLTLKAFFEKKGWNYALTLHGGANCLTNYVSDENVFVYLPHKIFSSVIKEAQDRLGFKQLKQGGNVHFVKPYYKNSVMHESQIIRGYQVVSNLQLYLDLYHFVPRGREHAEYLKELLEKEKRFP